MDWASFPDTVAERVLLAAVSEPKDVARFRVLERRVAERGASAEAWAEAAAQASLGPGVCASLRCSARAAAPDWRRALQSSAAGRLRCSAAPEQLLRSRCGGEAAERSGHAATVLRDRYLILFGGVQWTKPQAEEDQQPQEAKGKAVANLAVLDLLLGCWIACAESSDQPPAACAHVAPSPRLRPTLTAVGSAEAMLIGGQTYAGRGTGYPFADVWRLTCDAAGESLWREIVPDGCALPPRSCHTTVATPAGLVVVGGVGQEGNVLPCEAYCLSDGAWTLPPQSGLFPPQGALHHGCCYRGRLVLIGGVDDAGLQRRGLGRPTEVHILDVTTWVWERLARSSLTPPLHSRSAALPLGNRIILVGGDAGRFSNGQSDYATVLDLEATEATRAVGQAQAVWRPSSVTGLAFAASGHSVAGGILLGGGARTADSQLFQRSDAAAPAAFLLPDTEAPALPKAKAKERSGVPRWFKR
eukprot:TRINITY_DN461_c1_g3_i1.p1 TRINITY_DN461_c1_g3~~TRINITY_DN461_c1_g3_i1.p1  ORF type:complete len:482 (-),score=82.58 TRINITY_DN461_c1_g3_i1:55-1470(-)